jgi:eukaryotic-like serine/threonine-protein kinase
MAKDRKRIGKYEVAEQIGVGGFGVVYKAWDPFIQRWVAIKMCSSSDAEATQRFFREAQLAGALAHPNITLIYDFGVEDEMPYFVQEFLTGQDLDELMKAHTMSLEAVLAILIQVCAGLDFAHSKGIIHRDIKPANVRVLEDGAVKIMDFGIAKNLRSESRLTQTGVALGTAGYLAPEQLAGKTLDQRTDQFSLGVMAYELVGGKRPFVGPNLSNVIFQIINQDPQPLRKLNESCPERLQKAILKTLAKKPEDRFPGVRELAAELQSILDSLRKASVSARAESTQSLLRAELAKVLEHEPGGALPHIELAARPFEQVSSGQTDETAPEPRRHWVRWAVIAVVATALAATGLLLAGRGELPFGLGPQPTPTPRPTPTAAPTPRPTPTPTPTTLAPVSVELFVDPPSSIEVEGKSLGKVQTARVELTPGKHTVKQSIPDYREVVHEIEVTAAEQRITLHLPPFGVLTVVNDLDVPLRGATVLLDGKELGPLPVRARKVEAGRHALEVTWPDGSRFSETVQVPEGANLQRTVRPQSP